MDERVTGPLGAASPEIVPPPVRVSEELVEKDVFLTGEVNFLANAQAREERARKNLWLWIASYGLVLMAEMGVLLLVPNLFRHRTPTAEEQEIARKQMIFLPPG